jgi:hypothetical protein
LIGGQLLQRWTNDYFVATPNRSGGQRPEIEQQRTPRRLLSATWRKC